MASSLCSLVSAKSLGVGLRAGTVAANNTGSKGTSAFVFFVLAFTTGQSSRKMPQPQRQNPSRRWRTRWLRGGRGAGERRARDSSFFILHSSFEPSLPGCGAKRPCRSSGLRRGHRSARPKGPSPCFIIWPRAKSNARPQAPSNPAPSSNSNLRFVRPRLSNHSRSLPDGPWRATLSDERRRALGKQLAPASPTA